jgi:hypothetical protein
MVNKIIAVDFDGTIVAHAYPNIGREVPNAIRVLKKLQEQGTQLILWTMRSGDKLDEAVRYCEEKGITFWGINQNPAQSEWTDSPKAYAPIYIDDASLGCPTLWDEGTQRNMVNWRDVEAILIRKGVLIR